MNTEHTAIKAKLKALFAMTIENGCTEAEALAAAQKASELISTYNLSYNSEEEVKADRYGVRRRSMNGNLRRRNPHEVSYCTIAIGKLFNCKTWRTDKTIRIFFGTELDTETAHNMCDIICTTMELKFNKFVTTHPAGLDRRIIRKDFMLGMAHRINSRIQQIITARDIQTTKVAAETGKSLIIITKKQQLADNFRTYISTNNIRLTSGASNPRNLGSRAAYDAGQSAGSHVNLGQSAINSGVKLIK